MAVKIRMKRMGAKKKPFYRFVVADSRSHNPVSEPVELKIDVEKAEKWLKNGAQPTDTVRALFKKQGIIK